MYLPHPYRVNLYVLVADHGLMEAEGQCLFVVVVALFLRASVSVFDW